MADLVSMLAQSVRDHAARPLFGVRAPDGLWSWTTYAQFARQVDALRGGLALLGVRRGDRVALISRNRIEWAVACYATVGLGAAYVPMYEAQPERDWRHILTDSAARVCLVSGAAVVARAAEAARGISTLEHLVDFDAPADGSAGYRELL